MRTGKLMTSGLASDRKRKIKATLMASQNGMCWWCGDLMIEGDPLMLPTIEHLKPKAMNGTNSQENMVLACWKCNNDRGSSIEWEPHPKLVGSDRHTAWVEDQQWKSWHCAPQETEVDADEPPDLPAALSMLCAKYAK